MAYKNTTIVKVYKSLNMSIEGYMAHNPDTIKVCISAGNKKIERVMNFSLAPIVTCGKACKVCKGFCYDVKACLQYPNTVVDARARNTALLRLDRDMLFNAIDKAMSRRRRNKYFRWHVAGDIVDLDYFVRMVDNARNHPDFIIWTYTKQYSIVNEYCDIYGRDSIPVNFTIMFSKWDKLPMPNPYHFPVFACKLKAGNVDTSEDWFANVFKCPGNCDKCKASHRGCIAGEDTYVDEH